MYVLHDCVHVYVRVLHKHGCEYDAPHGVHAYDCGYMHHHHARDDDGYILRPIAHDDARGNVPHRYVHDGAHEYVRVLHEHDCVYVRALEHLYFFLLPYQQSLPYVFP